ncbi:hypothetical protein TIFTF001_018379 [Ficus carica]|uniref:Uncharacterized protein n=1 Tax=Ficus carica TaxID=3494 RepID=A0AA88DAP6_FICCA|nr:hypothetical protein TIFTF001_018379 [Ficus carica]
MLEPCQYKIYNDRFTDSGKLCQFPTPYVGDQRDQAAGVEFSRTKKGCSLKLFDCSKDEVFYDTNLSIDSDCEDFYSANGDTTPSLDETSIGKSRAGETAQPDKSIHIDDSTDSQRKPSSNKLLIEFLDRDSFNNDDNQIYVQEPDQQANFPAKSANKGSLVSLVNRVRRVPWLADGICPNKLLYDKFKWFKEVMHDMSLKDDSKRGQEFRRASFCQRFLVSFPPSGCGMNSKNPTLRGTAALKSHFHVRSNSLPSKLHPLLQQCNDCLDRLENDDAASSSSLNHKLSSLQDLHECVEKLLLLPPTQQAFVQGRQEQWVDQLVDGSLRLLDLCSAAKDAVLHAKECTRKIHSIMRRRRWAEVGLESEVKKYTASRKVVKKAIHKALTSLKSVERKSSFSPSNKDRKTTALISALRDVEALTLAIFESLLPLFMDQRLKLSSVVGL